MSFTPSFFTGDNLDAFGRLRTGGIKTLFESKFIHDGQPILWDSAVSDGGTASHSSVDARIRMAVTSTTGSEVIRQSYMRIPYETGNSTSVMIGVVPGSDPAGIRKRWGLFGEQDGIFFKLDGGLPQFGVEVRKAGATNISVLQPSFSLDPLDGSGSSGFSLDLTALNMFVMDFQWPGKIRFGVFFEGVPLYFHEIDNSNSLTSIYSSSPNQPARVEVTNTGVASTGFLDHVCTAVSSEGGGSPIGPIRSVSREGSSRNGSSNGDYYPSVGYRVQAARDGAILIPEQTTMVATTNNDNARLIICRNPTITGGALSTNNVSNSSAERLIHTGTVSTEADLGDILYESYARSRLIVNFDIRDCIWPGFSIDGTQDEIWLVIQSLSGGVTSYGSIGFREVG